MILYLIDKEVEIVNNWIIKFYELFTEDTIMKMSYILNDIVVVEFRARVEVEYGEGRNK